MGWICQPHFHRCWTIRSERESVHIPFPWRIDVSHIRPRFAVGFEPNLFLRLVCTPDEPEIASVHLSHNHRQVAVDVVVCFPEHPAVCLNQREEVISWSLYFEGQDCWDSCCRTKFLSSSVVVVFVVADFHIIEVPHKIIPGHPEDSIIL